MRYIPDQGDIIWLDFDPSAGSEIVKRRPALVLSRKIFNEITGFSMVAPITSTERKNKFTVKIPTNNKTEGYALLYQARTLDYDARCAEKIESVEKIFIKEANELVKLIVS
ncbi:MULTISPECIES: type II toxin-antitoxin system PemK/MazF family toxin [Francisella]|uniref:type II toxin-antitoxin system PemK/MazF family toxin n=1 Tax=Francisella TaxID=262 RepID=UPI000507726A|nr:type II toxin-antitoxin system PemK/MazF family toxin [Francisella tularensis]AJJ48301.1 pemK-like family protein [Francisella tularensis subsp. novicida]KFJ70805.1 mRNA interferase MazF [Francisella tularensis subsp. novicida]MBK2345292.1 type II toxin-antitoxin system PemK/MazF family toxin [Francisella tularensis subsp. novicida]MBK2350640.1 type II toxin-antitoxin system PemK/MazF family toxin [Francisella tularensis subsp. novicida]MBK2354201.1 type II toxin-antitoxin system PemK/MazF 